MNIKILKGNPTQKDFKQINEMIICGHTNNKNTPAGIDWETNEPKNKYIVIPCCKTLLTSDLINWNLQHKSEAWEETKPGEFYISTGEECGEHKVTITHCPFCGNKLEVIENE